MKIHFQALGCRLNEAELESWSNDFIRKGHQLTHRSDDADIVVFNSCSVTAEADRKSRKLINRIHRANPDSRLVVTGCYASLQAEQVKDQLGVDLVIPNQEKDALVDKVLNLYPGIPVQQNTDEGHAIFDRGRQRAFIKIQDGCRYRCTFCIVTLARGEERSRTRQQVIDDINRYHLQGVQEVVITGVHVGGYGSDRGDTLYALLSEILDKTTIPRIRLASVEPWDLGEEFFVLFKDKRLMPHMHLPLQSGSDRVLRRMARRCKTREFAKMVDKARTSIPFFNITTDIIVGFPGESEEDWQETLAFVERIGFGHIHIFTYSPRSGTKAAAMPDQVDMYIKKARSAQLHEVAGRLRTDAMRQLIGETCDVLWEHKLNGSDREWLGYTQQYHRVKIDNPRLKSSQISEETITALEQDGPYLIASSSP